MRTFSEENSNFFKAKDSQHGHQYGAKTNFRAQLHLTGITKEGDFEITQGFNDMPGVIKKEAIDLYYNRFDFFSRDKIMKHLEKKK